MGWSSYTKKKCEYEKRFKILRRQKYNRNFYAFRQNKDTNPKVIKSETIIFIDILKKILAKIIMLPEQENNKKYYQNNAMYRNSYYPHEGLDEIKKQFVVSKQILNIRRKTIKSNHCFLI